MTDRTITPFLFEGEITVRVIDRDGAPWFVATDICRALGITNAAETVRGLDEDEKGISTTDTLGGHQEVIVISESGLYTLIFKSRKPRAARFRKWITSEVLPALRLHGAYAMLDHSGRSSRKAWEDWSLAEMRSALAQVNTARLVFNQAAGAWMWEHVGLPLPPSHLLPAWWQFDLRIQPDASTS